MPRWRNSTWDWKRRFAFLPVCVGGECRWLVTFWERFEGDAYSVSWTDPRSRQSLQGAGE